MEIQNFKMRVTPEQSRIVQQTLFNNGYRWKGESSTTIIQELEHPYLYLESVILFGDSEKIFSKELVPELTFQKFFDTYVKWCVKVTEENREVIYQWKRNNTKCSSHTKPNCYVFFDGTWSDRVSDGIIELTFEQFKKYVLKSKDMEKVIGYRLREEYSHCKENAEYIAGFIRGEVSTLEDFIYRGGEFKDKLKKAGVLDLWFEPVFEESSKELYFGKVKFTIKKGDNFATTEYGKVTKEDIEDAISWIENPPKLAGNTLSIHYNSTYCKITELDNNGTLSYGFGCQEGSLKELKTIYNAFK